MAAPHDNPHSARYERRVLARLTSFASLDEQEKAVLASLAHSPRQLQRGERIRAQDDAPTYLHLLVDGWAASAVGLPDGSRQLNALCLPGDVLGLPSLALAEPIDEIVALSTVVVLEMPVDSIGRLFAESPRLAALLFLVSQEERALAMERLAQMGQASARARLAALFLRLAERMAQLEDDTSGRFALPLTQRDMGDLIGVSAVHLNATLKWLRGEGVIKLKNRELEILDFELLREIADLPSWRRARPAWLPPHGTKPGAGAGD